MDCLRIFVCVESLCIYVYIVSAVFFILGVLTYSSKMYDIMIAYHNMSKEKRQKISIEKYAKVWRIVLISFAFALFLSTFVFQYLGVFYFLGYCLVIIICKIAFLIKLHE